MTKGSNSNHLCPSRWPERLPRLTSHLVQIPLLQVENATFGQFTPSLRVGPGLPTLCSGPEELGFSAYFSESFLHTPSCPSYDSASWLSPTSPYAHAGGFSIHTWGLGAAGWQHVSWGTVCPSAGGSGVPAPCSAGWPRARAISFSKPGNRPTPVTLLPSLPYSFGTTLHRSEQNLKCFCSLLNKHFFHRNQFKLITVQTPGAEGNTCSLSVGT